MMCMSVKSRHVQMSEDSKEVEKVAGSMPTWRKMTKHSENADQLDDAADSAYDHASEAYAAHEYDEVSEHYPDLEYGYDAEADNAEVASAAGASNDEDIFQAFSAMDKQRKTYKEARKETQRGSEAKRILPRSAYLGAEKDSHREGEGA